MRVYTVAANGRVDVGGASYDPGVPRTVDLKKIRKSFVGVVDDGTATWNDLGSSARRKTVAEDVFLRMGVAWETFISDWFIGAINHDASRFRKVLERKMTAWLNQEVDSSPYKNHASAFPAPRLSIGKNPKIATVRELLDPGEGNIEFRSYDDLRHRSRDHHVPKFVARIEQLDGAGAEIIEATLAMRNALAHRSVKAVKQMNTLVAAFPSYPSLRKATMSKNGIGTYLAADAGAGDARLLAYATELKRISVILIP